MNLMDNNSEKLKKCASQVADDVIATFQVCDTGYSEREAELARRKYGSNDLTNQKQDTIIHCIRRAFVNPFSVVLFFLGVISLFADVLLVEGHRSNATSVIIIFSMLFISGIVRLTQELKAKKISDELTTLVQSSVSVLRDGKWAEIPSGEIVVGDQVRLEAGDRVPADMRVTEGSDLFVSQSVITGESMILEKTADPLTEEPKDFSDYSNILFGGTTITGGCGKGIVLAVGAETVYGGLSIQTHRKNNGFDRGANSIAWIMIRFMAVLVPIVFLASGLTKGNWMQSFLFALSVAVGLTPELLPMVVNACLAKGSYSMGKKQTIVKNINAMQSLGSMDVLCVDKTGTLTGDQVILEYYMDILGNESQKTLDYAFLASHYHTGVGNHLDTAIQSIQTMPGKSDYYKTLVQTHGKMDEHPFDYSRRFSSVVVQDGEDGLLIIKGSIDEVVRKCRYAEHAGNVMQMKDDPASSVHAVVDEMLEDGMKVIAVAYKHLTDDGQLSNEENDFILLGYLAFFDAPKKSAVGAISKLQDLSVNIKVLTGDQMLVAQSICKRLGIPTTHVITGAELERLSDNELPIIVENTTVFAGLSPKQKETIVELLQSNGHTVGFLGDGMNDLPAIMQADVGISVENAAEAVKDSANVILLKKDLGVLEEGILEGRKAFANMTKYIKITASSNFGNICAIVIASVLLPFFPMTSVQLLLLNLLYDLLCLILPWDKVDSEMLEQPLEWSGKKLGGFMTFFGPLSSIFDLVTFAVLFFMICPVLCGGSFGILTPEKQSLFIAMFQTGWFLESMWTQVLILQLLRTGKIPFVQSKPGKPVIIITVMGIVLYTILPITVFGRMLGLCKMPPIYYVFLVLVVTAYLLVVTIAKTIYIRKKGNLI